MSHNLSFILMLLLLLPFGSTSNAQHNYKKYIEEEYSFVYSSGFNVALDSLNSRISRTPDDHALYYYRAWCQYIYGNVNLAFEEVNNYLGKPQGKHLYGAYILLGHIHKSRFIPRFAHEAYDRAIAIDPNRSEAYLEKSRTYAFTSEYEEGIAFCSKSIKMFPNIDEFYLYRGLLYAYIRGGKKALSDLEVAVNSSQLADSPMLSEAYFGTAKSYLSLKDYEMGLENVEKGLELSPDYTAGYGLLGEIKFHLEDYEGALAAFTRYERSLKNTNYYNIIGETYEALGDVTTACEYYLSLIHI